MSRLKLPHTTRIGIWLAYLKKCAYCGDLINFGDLAIDHIVPETLSGETAELERVKAELGLSPDFQVNSLSNLVPAHHRCNLAKSDRVYHAARARYFLELASAKEAAVRRYIDSIGLQDQKAIFQRSRSTRYAIRRCGLFRSA